MLQCNPASRPDAMKCLSHSYFRHAALQQPHACVGCVVRCDGSTRAVVASLTSCRVGCIAHELLQERAAAHRAAAAAHVAAAERGAEAQLTPMQVLRCVAVTSALSLMQLLRAKNKNHKPADANRRWSACASGEKTFRRKGIELARGAREMLGWKSVLFNGISTPALRARVRRQCLREEGAGPGRYEL